MEARGVRNNNPLNIRTSPTDWDGMTPEQTDPAFVQFVSPEWGIRAAVRILRTYQRRGLRTLRQMIGAWAPPSENPTDAYVEHVAAACGVDADATVNLDAVLPAMLRAMIAQENGACPYPAEIIERAIDMA